MKVLLVVLVLLVAGYMLFDGVRALTVGDYVRPSSGEYAGQLGPWAFLVKAVGIDPMSTFMKVTFVVYGAAWLGTLAFYLARAPWAHGALIVAAIGSLLYLPFGTLLGIVQLFLLWKLKSG